MKVAMSVALAAVCSLLVVGCVTAPPPPNGSSDTLLVGGVVFTVQGLKTYGGATANGKQANNVEITLLNAYTNAKIEVRTHGPNGLFYIAGLKPGEYEISRLYYRDTVGSSWADVTFTPRTLFEFRVDPGGVSNIGFIRAKFDELGSNSIASEHEFKTLRTEFRKLFTNSPWNSAPWRTVPLFPNTA